MEKMNAADLATLRMCLPVLGVKDDVDEFIKKKLKDDKIKLNSNGQVTYLNLYNNQLSGEIPKELGNLSALKELNLRDNQLSGQIPKELGNLSALTNLRLSNNQLSGEIPKELGNLSALTYLDLSYNKLSGEIPKELGNLSALKLLWLEKNQLSGQIPKELGNLSALKELDLHRNKKLKGALPVFKSEVEVTIEGTKIIPVRVKPKQLHDFGTPEGFFDDFMTIQHVLFGYGDLVTDILAIIDLFQTQRIGIAVANMFFIVLDIGLGIKNSEQEPIDWFLNITQLSILVNGYTTLYTREQTVELLVNKKVDAICRSLPSVILQLYSLLIDLDDYPPGSRTYKILIASVALGIFGPALTLAGIHSKTGDTIFSKQFVIVNIYYYGELLFRVLTVSIAFISVGPYAFIAVGIDCALRYFIIQDVDKENLNISSFVLYLGSDTSLDKEDGWYRGSILTFVEAIVFIIVMFTLDTGKLHSMRARGTALHITLFMIAGLLVKTGLHFYIAKMPEAQKSIKTLANEFRKEREVKNKMHEERDVEMNK